MISSLVPALISAFKARRELALENVALRQQLAVLRRSVKRPRLSNVDRGFWVLLRRIWTDWESVLVIVKPETVIRWHRCGFRRYWTWKSRRRKSSQELQGGYDALGFVTRGSSVQFSSATNVQFSTGVDIWLENGPICPEMVPNCLLMACFSLVSSQDRMASVAPTRACRLR